MQVGWIKIGNLVTIYTMEATWLCASHTLSRTSVRWGWPSIWDCLIPVSWRKNNTIISTIHTSGALQRTITERSHVVYTWGDWGWIEIVALQLFSSDTNISQNDCLTGLFWVLILKIIYLVFFASPVHV